MKRVACLRHGVVGTVLAALIGVSWGGATYARAANLDDADLDARIDKLRRTEVTITFADTSGQSLAGRAEYELARHAFPFGTCVSARMLGLTAPRSDASAPPASGPAASAPSRRGGGPPTAEDKECYARTLAAYFNAAVDENAMKWYAMEPQRDEIHDTVPLATYQWCHDRGMDFRGHCIYWGVPKYVPAWVKTLDKDQLEPVMHARLAHVLKLFDGKITEFDLNNEMMHGDHFAKVLGLKTGATYFKWAKAAAPKATFYVNDYDVISRGNADTYVGHIKAMLDEGAPIGGIGDQAHFGDSIPSTDRLWAVLEALGQFKLPVKITEFDNQIKDPQKQAAETRRFYRVCFAHPAVAGIYMWGFWEGAHWRPEGALWKRDWTIKPNGEAFVKLMRQEWTTRGAADLQAGQLRFRGFYGQYRIRIAGKDYRATIVPGQAAVAAVMEESR